MVSINSLNDSPLFNIIAWISGVTTLLLVAIKLGLAYASFGWHPDDWSILVATIASVIQICVATLQSYNGLGRPQDTISPALLEEYEKVTYIAEFFNIISLAASKLSVVLLTYFLTRDRVRRTTAIITGTFIILWSLSSLFVTAFQCSSPHLWSLVTGKCIKKIPFRTTFAAINILTELLLIVLPSQIIWDTKIDQRKKSVLVFCFALRLSVIAAIAAQIYCLYTPNHLPFLKTGKDATFHSWPYMVSTEIVQALSIITVCIPFIRPLLIGLQTGMLQTGHIGLPKRKRRNVARPTQEEEFFEQEEGESLNPPNMSKVHFKDDTVSTVIKHEPNLLSPSDRDELWYHQDTHNGSNSFMASASTTPLVEAWSFENWFQYQFSYLDELGRQSQGTKSRSRPFYA